LHLAAKAAWRRGQGRLAKPIISHRPLTLERIWHQNAKNEAFLNFSTVRVVTAFVTVFHIATSRSGAIARQLLGEDYAGVVGSDRASAYNWLDPTQRQLCWSP
jgi:hypothetical protein